MSQLSPALCATVLRVNRGVYVHFTQAAKQKKIIPASGRFASRNFFRRNTAQSRSSEQPAERGNASAARSINQSVAMTDSGWPVPQENLHIANWGERRGGGGDRHQTHYTSSSSDTMRLMETSNAGSQQSSCCRTWYTSPGRAHVWTHPWPDLILSHQSPPGSRPWKC